MFLLGRSGDDSSGDDSRGDGSGDGSIHSLNNIKNIGCMNNKIFVKKY